MALHFSTDEYATRRARLSAAMKEQDIDAMFLFSPESHYWLTGFDTFGFCFFQCLIFTVDGEMALLTRSADLRQARHTSNIDTIVIWPDRANADPTRDLKDLADQFDLLGKKVGIEYNSHGLVASNGRKLDARFESYCDLIDGSGIVPKLRAVKSEEELLFVTKAGE
ncbi:MAG: aminopeptidase P family N-terminal domain-containing protein, partial [Pseudomonadota bacterium]